MRTRNIVLLIIIIILVLFGILFFVVNEGGVDDLIQPLDRDVSLANYKEFIDKNNYCTIDEDCVGRETYHCLGCYYIVNKNTDFDKIKSLGRDARRGRTSCWNEMACSNPRQEDIECINNKCEANQKSFLYLPNRVVEIKQGKKGGMAFRIQNVVKEQKFRWEIKVNDPDISRKCGVREQEAERWITNGRVGRVEIASGQRFSAIATFNIPEGSVSDISTCIIRYNLVIREEDGEIYDTSYFEVDIR